MTRSHQAFPLALMNGAQERANDPLPGLSTLSLSGTPYTPGSQGARSDALKLLANRSDERRNPYVDWLRLGRPAQQTGRSRRAGT